MKKPAFSSSLSKAFSSLDGGWHSYIRYVRIAASDEKDPGDMTKLLEHFDSLPSSQQKKITPENLCLESGVSLKTFIGSILPFIWMYSNTAASITTALYNPAVIEKTAKAALGKGRFAHKDRELFLKVSGALPTPKPSSIQILNQNSPVAQSSSGSPIRLPSPAEDVMELEAGDNELE